MGEMRRLMEQELRLRGYADRTVEAYVQCVKRFAAFYWRPPEEMGSEEVHGYLVHLTNENKAFSTVNQMICALRFFYVEVLGRADEVERVHYQKRKKQTLPSVLSPQEVSRLVRATPNLKHRTIIMALYSAGLRLSEVIGLQVGDVDSASMRVRVREAKGGRERQVMLSETLLGSLRDYYRVYRPVSWLFFGRDKGRPLSSTSIQRMIKKWAVVAGLGKRVTPHVLRHSFATHLLETGTNLRYIQELLGHKSIQTTMGYTRVSRRGATQVVSPLDRLALERS